MPQEARRIVRRLYADDVQLWEALLAAGGVIEPACATRALAARQRSAHADCEATAPLEDKGGTAYGLGWLGCTRHSCGA